MAPRRDDERELQVLLRNIAAVVLLFTFVFIALAAVLVPVLTDSAELDTTLLLGLSASIMGALPVLLGVQLALSRKDKDE